MYKSKKETQIETLYLLIALSQLGREYRLNLKVLCTYFNISIKKDNSVYEFLQEAKENVQFPFGNFSWIKKF